MGNASDGAPLVMTDSGIVAYGSDGGTKAGPAGTVGAPGAPVDVVVPVGAGIEPAPL